MTSNILTETRCHKTTSTKQLLHPSLSSPCHPLLPHPHLFPLPLPIIHDAEYVNWDRVSNNNINQLIFAPSLSTPRHPLSHHPHLVPLYPLPVSISPCPIPTAIFLPAIPGNTNVLCAACKYISSWTQASHRRKRVITLTSKTAKLSRYSYVSKNVKLQRRIFLSTSLHLIFLKHSCISVDPDQNIVSLS